MFKMSRLALVTGAAMAVSAFGVAPASALSADASPRAELKKCDAHYVCLFSKWAGGGERCQYTQSQSDLLHRKPVCSFAPEVRSVTNHRSEYAHLYPMKDYKGGEFACIAPGHTVNIDNHHKTRSMKVNHTRCG